MWQWIISAAGVVVAAAIAAWAGRRGSRDSPYEALAKRVTDQETRIGRQQEEIDALRDEVRVAKDEAREARHAGDRATGENVAWADHHMSVIASVATLRGPWPAVPVELRHRISDSDYPPLPVMRPPDDGQPADPT